jgi:acetyl esterase
MTAHPNLLPELAAVAGAADIDITDVAAARRRTEESSKAAIDALSYEGVDVTEISAPGLGGNPDVPIRFLRPVAAVGTLPVLLAIHGGGFVLGRAQEFEYFCVEVVRELGIAVANVEYRLAPETPFPGPLDDCYAALLHVSSRADELGVDPALLAVAGSSAGGGLAAGIVLRARDEGGPAIAYQLLLSPALDDRSPSSTEAGAPDADADADAAKESTGALVWRYYLGPGYSGPADAAVSAYAAPARAADLSGLPPTSIATMEIDPVRTQGIEFALRLLDAGVSVELHSHPGTFHGSVEFAPTAPSSGRILRGLLDGLGRALSRSPHPH